MAAKGSVLKQEIAEKILKTFPDSFLYNDGKEIRINGTEDGVPLQIKVVLTCAKVAVSIESDIALPGEDIPVNVGMNPPETNEKVPQEPSQEEKERLATLLDKLGL